MDTSCDEDTAPTATAAPPSIAAPSPAVGRRSHAADQRILSAAFFFIFCAYLAVQNLESTVNKDGNLGAMSLGVLYTSFTVFAGIVSPAVRWVGSKRALVVGTSGYVLFIAANLARLLPLSLFLCNRNAAAAVAVRNTEH